MGIEVRHYCWTQHTFVSMRATSLICLLIICNNYTDSTMQVFQGHTQTDDIQRCSLVCINAGVRVTSDSPA